MKIDVFSNDDNYSVYIEEGYFKKLPELLNEEFEKRIILTDTNVFTFHKKNINALKNKIKAEIIVLPSGERSKSFRYLNNILSFLIEKRFSRESCIIAIGGGVVGDISGLAASLFMRGIKVVHVPTTLLACVDSSVGGKTGINYKGIKNIIGTFYNPEFVLVDPLFLRTLPDEEFKSGMGEVIKYAFLSGDEFYKNASSLKSLKKYDFEKLCTIINHCLLFKASIIKVDEKDKGVRKLLNYGHTFGHALESVSNFKIRHGIAVIYGIIASLHLSKELEIISDMDLQSYLHLPNQFILKKKLRLDESEVIRIMHLDKKNSKDQISFVLLKKPGEMLLNVSACEKAIASVIKKSLL